MFHRGDPGDGVPPESKSSPDCLESGKSVLEKLKCDSVLHSPECQFSWCKCCLSENVLGSVISP
jgi:hypothetical protein